MLLNNPQMSMAGFFPEYEHPTPKSFQHVLEILDEKSTNTYDKGHVFEQLIKAFIQEDKAQSQRFDNVWLWSEYPNRDGRIDPGIDLVAQEASSGNLIAIQAKFYAADASVSRGDVNKFITEYSKPEFSGGIFVSTTSRWSGQAEKAIEGRPDKPIQRWGPEVFENSSIDWSRFSLTSPKSMSRRETKDLREYQVQAVEDVMAGFSEYDRGKMIMACGTGKTFIALRLAEEMVGSGGSVLFLTPSISLLSQSLIDWANDAQIPLKTLAVCSDTKAGKRRANDEDASIYDLSEPASTDAATLAGRFSTINNQQQTMIAIFSTYQSLDVVSEAQRMGKNLLPEFDLIICDEAHRTTGVRNKALAGKDESGFQRIHDNGYIAGKKRLYMTATPRIFSDSVRRKANESKVPLASMDDEGIYGPEFHRLGFGKATEMGILSDYKVVIFHMDEEQVGVDLHGLLSDSTNEIDMDNGARMVACWNGLRKKASEGADFSKDPLPARRAVAFSNLISQSQQFATYFPQVIESCIAAGNRGDSNDSLRCEVKHVDGKQNALRRLEHLAWLRDEVPEGTCKILTNARCLTEGVDVPALDAILFLHPRRSDIDVVQAVGRVMRKAPGKEFGYIILPIAHPRGVSPRETVKRSAYKHVWQVINAISAHDDRFEAEINQWALKRESQKTRYIDEKDMARNDKGSEEDDEGLSGLQGRLIVTGAPELQDAFNAEVVDKYANPAYWETWAKDIRAIAERHEARIKALLNNPSTGARASFQQFLKGIQNDLNSDITEDEAIGILSQHLVTKPVFDALFGDYDFAERNPVSLAMQQTIETLQEYGLEKETKRLEDFYRDVRIRAEGVTDAESKQTLIKDLYGRFLTLALPATARNLGIAYTPVEVVDWIIRSVEDVLNEKFGASLSDEGVHIIDPFVGTGTFIARLLGSEYIKPKDLNRKYTSELHANDILLLAYYIAAINIESTYHDRAATDEYEPFEGIVLTDTFETVDRDISMDDLLVPGNSERIEKQKKLNIRVVVGNPPWSAKNNRTYPVIDGRVRTTYAKRSKTQNINSLYDPYVKAIRMASDRIMASGDGGIVAFVTNGGFVDANAFDGFRKVIADEFDTIYCYNLRGNANSSGERRQKEGGGVFGSDSRVGVAILMLVREADRRSRQAKPTGEADRRSRQAKPTGEADRRSRQAKPTGRQYTL